MKLLLLKKWLVRSALGDLLPLLDDRLLVRLHLKESVVEVLMTMALPRTDDDVGRGGRRGDRERGGRSPPEPLGLLPPPPPMTTLCPRGGPPKGMSGPSGGSTDRMGTRPRRHDRGPRADAPDSPRRRRRRAAAAAHARLRLDVVDAVRRLHALAAAYVR